MAPSIDSSMAAPMDFQPTLAVGGVAPTLMVSERDGRVHACGYAVADMPVKLVFPDGETELVVADWEGWYTATSRSAQPRGTVSATVMHLGRSDLTVVNRYVGAPWVDPLPANERRRFVNQLLNQIKYDGFKDTVI